MRAYPGLTWDDVLNLTLPQYWTLIERANETARRR